jgi:hypothetical protein
MDSWEVQRESAKAVIAEIESKIALQTQRAEQLRSQNKDASLPDRLISVLRESLARTKTYAEYIVTAQVDRIGHVGDGACSFLSTAESGFDSRIR